MLSEKIITQDVFGPNIDSKDYSTMKHTIENVVKRGVDIACSLFFIMLFSPIFFFVAVLIKVDSKGAVFLNKNAARKVVKNFLC